MYTEIYINVDLKQDTPNEIIDTLGAICKGVGVPAEYPDRWKMLFGNGSHYTPLTSVANLTYNDIAKQWSLLGKGDIKNYAREIEKFFDWIMPYIEAEPGMFIGYFRYEEHKLPTIVLKK